MKASRNADKEEEIKARERIRQKLEADKVFVWFQPAFCFELHWLLKISLIMSYQSHLSGFLVVGVDQGEYV